MSSSPLNLKTSYHVRSISLPSRSHPLTVNVEQQLCHLRSSAAATNCSSPSTSYNLNEVTALHDSMEDLLQLSSTQQALVSSGRSNTCMMNEVLDGSLRLLEFCSTTREVFLQIKERVQDLQSALRRRKEVDLAKDIRAYMIVRKKIDKMIEKSLNDLKKSQNRYKTSPLLEKDHNLVAVIGVLREVEALTFSMLKSFLSSSKAQSTKNGWFATSKLTQTKRVASQGEEDPLGLQKLELALKSTCIKVENVQTHLETVEMSLQNLEDGLESIYKRLIKTRVALLNIWSQ